MRASVRKDDVVCRWGGDEFIILMPGSTLADAQGRAARIESASFGEFILEHGGRRVRVDVSAAIGVAEYTPGETAEEFFNRADQILYRRKADLARQVRPARAGVNNAKPV